MSSLLVEGMTLAEREAALEADNAPSGSTRWARSRGTLAEHLSSNPPDWTRHEKPEDPLQPIGRRMRGDQSYSTLHLGRGTKWIKPGANR